MTLQVQNAAALPHYTHGSSKCEENTIPNSWLVFNYPKSLFENFCWLLLEKVLLYITSWYKTDQILSLIGHIAVKRGPLLPQRFPVHKSTLPPKVIQLDCTSSWHLGGFPLENVWCLSSCRAPRQIFIPARFEEAFETWPPIRIFNHRTSTLFYDQVKVYFLVVSCIRLFRLEHFPEHNCKRVHIRSVPIWFVGCNFRSHVANRSGLSGELPGMICHLAGIMNLSGQSKIKPLLIWEVKLALSKSTAVINTKWTDR